MIPERSFHMEFNAGMALSHASFFAMNTHIVILFYNVTKEKAVPIYNNVFYETLRIESLLSRFNPASQIFKINTNKTQSYLEVNEELYLIFEECKKLNEQSNFYFDISINTPDFKDPGIKDLSLKISDQKYFIKKDRLQFDFGAFAKGYALDKINSILDRNLVQNALVNFGNSSILAKGHHPHGKCWKIGLQHTLNPAISVYSFDLYDQILTTSGPQAQKNAHIKSPVNNELCSEMATYSVVTKLGTTGEAASTALYAAQDQKLQQNILENLDIESAIKIKYDQMDFMVQQIVH